MDKYIVKVIHVFSNLIEVEANSKEDAREKALENVQNAQEPFKNYYESTLPPENWAVILKEDFEKIKAEIENNVKSESANEEKSNIVQP